MLGYRGIAKAQEFGEVADRALAVDQLTNDQQPMAIGQGFQEIAGGIGGGFHDVRCSFSYLRIYDDTNI